MMRIISMNSKLCMKCMLEADWSFLELCLRERPLVHRGVFLFVLTKTLPPLLVRRLAVVTVYMARLLRCFPLIAYLFSVFLGCQMAIKPHCICTADLHSYSRCFTYSSLSDRPFVTMEHSSSAIERLTYNSWKPGSNPLCYHFEARKFPFPPRRPS